MKFAATADNRTIEIEAEDIEFAMTEADDILGADEIELVPLDEVAAAALAAE